MKVKYHLHAVGSFIAVAIFF